MLRRIFGPRRGEVTRGWRKLNNEVFHNFYSTPNIISEIKSRMSEAYSKDWKDKNSTHNFGWIS
jgi:hypothetical protein